MRTRRFELEEFRDRCYRILQRNGPLTIRELEDATGEGYALCLLAVNSKVFVETGKELYDVKR